MKPGKAVDTSNRGFAGAPVSICFFSHLPDLAGAERTLLELVTQLIGEYGVRCMVVVPGDGPLISRLEAAGAEVLRTEYCWWCDAEEIPESEVRRRMDGDLERLHQEIIPAVNEINPDVICTQTIVIPWGALAATELGKPHIWNLREHGEAEGFRFFRPFDEVSEFIREHSDFVFCANTRLCEQVIPDLQREDHDVLYPSFEVPSEIHESSVCQFSSSHGSFHLAEFATIAPLKRLDVSVNAVEHLTTRGWAVDLLIAGHRDPAHVEELVRLIDHLGLGDRVHLEGFIDNIFPAMAAADAVVISAPIHALGRTAVEGMLLAKPVVYPLGTGFDDYIDDGVTGLGYAAGDAGAMADRIDFLIGNPDLGHEIGRRAQASARAKFTRDGFGGKFYRKALALRGDLRTTGCKVADEGSEATEGNRLCRRD